MPSKKIKATEKLIKEKIITLLKESPRYIPDLYRSLKLTENKDQRLVQKIMKNLFNKKIVARDKKGLLRVVLSKKYITGKIAVVADGYGFVSSNDGNKDSKDVFIPGKHIGTALNGDTVKVRLFDDTSKNAFHKKGPVGIVCKVKERSRPFLVGELLLSSNGFVVRPLNRKLPHDIKVSGSCQDAKCGDWVKADLLYDHKKTKGTVCKIAGIIGEVGNADDDIRALISEYNLAPPYTEEEENKALELHAEEVKREDLTSLFSVTIDPHDAKDFDDAISISEGEKKGELIVGIHIADVAAWIKPESYFDKEAALRGFTAYIPGNTLPMLPRELTASISLTPDKINLAHSVLLTIDKNTGEIKNQSRCHSKIKIAARLNFKEVEAYIQEGIKPEGCTDELESNLDTLIKTYHTMRRYRKENEKFLDISTTEIRVLRDDNSGKILGLERKKQGAADQLVEEFMLAANTAVARELTNNQIPGIYRIHPEPDEDKIDEFSDFVKNVFGLNTGNLNSGREACQNFLNKIEGKDYEEIIVSAFLQSLNRAIYDEKTSIHYGLGKGLYSHFTSPIRRYPDLVVHQQLWMTDKSKKAKNTNAMAKISADCTAKEKQNDEVYFAANDRLKLHYLQKILDENKSEPHEGVIRKITASTIFADIPDIGITAVIPGKKVKGRFRKSHGKLIASIGSPQYKPGDVVYLKLQKIDFIKGNAIFRPIQF